MRGVTLGKLKPSPTAAALLGEVSLTWSQLEFRIQNFIAMLADTDPRVSSVFTFKAGMEKWIVWSQHLIALRYSPNEDAMTDWAITEAALREGQKKRNELTHAFLSSSAAWRGVRAQKVVRRGKNASLRLDVEHPVITITEIRETLRSIEVAISQLAAWELEYLFPIGAAKPSPAPLVEPKKSA